MDEREVDDAIGLLRAGAQAVEVVEGTAMDLRACGGDGFGRGVRTREADDLVAGLDQLGDDGGADETGRAGDEVAHGDLQVT